MGRPKASAEYVLWMAVLVTCGGCHAIVPLERRAPGGADSGHIGVKAVFSRDAGARVGYLDGQGPDVEAARDTGAMAARDQAGGLYHEDFEDDSGAVVVASRTCVVEGGKLRQTSEALVGVCGTVFVGLSDFRVEATVTVDSLGSDPLDVLLQGAGVGVRVRDSGPPAEVKPGYYACVVSPDGGRLSVAWCARHGPMCGEVTFGPAAVGFKTAYRLRATVTGDRLSCEIPGTAAVTWPLVGPTSGAVSLVSLAARASFDDFRLDPL